MLALPAAPAPAPRRQVLVGTTLACVAGATFYGGMLALYLRFRQHTLDTGGVWRPADTVIPEVPTNVVLFAFVGACVFAQWAVYAARRGHRTYTTLAIALTALMGAAIINAQAFVWSQLELGFSSGTYAVFVYALTGTFVALTIIGIAFSVVAAFRSFGGRSSDREVIAGHAIYWYFLAAVYAALWFVVYVTK